jgi:hypothetical protein
MNTSGASGPLEQVKLTFRQVAELHGVCERTVRNWAKEGLRVIKVRRKVWVDPCDLRAFFERHKIGGEA